MTIATDARAELAALYANARQVRENPPDIIPSATDEAYAGVSVRSAAGSAEYFNGEAGRTLYDVVVSGVELHWPHTSTFYTRLSGRSDLLNVSIYADTLRITEPIKLPGANVTIHARVLRFDSERAVIDTTPISATHPAERASAAVGPADGKDGTDGGNIFLRVAEFWIGDERVTAATAVHKPRLISTGGDGQNGELPRLGGEPPVSLTPISVEEMRQTIRGFGILSSPDDFAFPDLSKFDAGQVVHVNFMTFNVLAYGGITCTWIPGGVTTSPKLPTPDALEELWQATPIGRKNPGDGQSALPGGRPGNGGRGGDIEVLNVRLASSVGGKKGMTAGLAGGPPGSPRPAYHARVLATRKVFSYETALPRADYFEATGAPGKGQPAVYGHDGAAGAIRVPTRAWFSVELLAPLIRYASDLFANGFRDRACEALGPYHFLRDDGNVTASAAVVQLIELTHRIDSNLDDFGHVPGWVPRLNASTTFAILDSQLGPNLELMSLSGACLRDWDALVDRQKVLSLTLDSLEREQNALWGELDEGYAGLTGAKQQLAAIDADVEGVDLEMATFRRAMAAKIAADETRRNMYQGAAAVVGGLLQLCPVGQPYVGAASAVFKAAEQFAADEGASFASLGNSVSTQVQGFLKEQEDMFKSRGNSSLRQRVIEARKQVRSHDDRIAAIKHQVEESDRDTVLRRDWAARRDAVAALERYDLLHPDDDTDSRAELARAVAQETVMWRKHRTEQEIAQYEVRRKQAQSQVDRSKEDLEQRNQAVSDAMRRVKLASAGVGDLIRGIGLLTSSMRPDDPSILAKVDEVIEQLPPDSDLGDQYRRIIERASLLSRRRGEAASMVLLQGQRIASALAGIAMIVESAASLTDLRSDVADATLGVELRSTFEGIQIRSRRRIESQMSAFARAFQYEHLRDVPPSFKGLSLVLPRLSTYRLRRVKAGAGPTAGDPVLATDRDFAAVVIRDAYLSLANALIEQRALRPASTIFTSLYSLNDEERVQLAKSGRLVLNLVAAGLVSLREVKHRIRLVEVVDMAMTTVRKGDQVRFAIGHAEAPLLRDAHGYYYAFRQGADEAPINWAWRYQAVEAGNSMRAWHSETMANDDEVVKNVLQRVLPGTALQLREYFPSSFSDMVLALEVGGVSQRIESVVSSLDKLTLKFTFEHEPQSPKLRKAGAAVAARALAQRE